MTAIREYDVVRVLSLEGCSRYPSIGTRVPAIGDAGIVVSVLSVDGYPNRCLVECRQPGGMIAWKASFVAHSLQRIELPGNT